MAAQVEVNVLCYNGLDNEVNLALELLKSFFLLVALLIGVRISTYPPGPVENKILMEVKPIESEKVEHYLRI